MNGDRYNWLVESKFAKWRKACFPDDKPVKLVQDHEKCLWMERNLAALKAARCPMIKRYPKHSPDLNAIENWWKVLAERMRAAEPAALESRAQFVARLRRNVK